MLSDLIINLIAAFIGILLARGYGFLREEYRRRTITWFWAPNRSRKIYLFFGNHKNLLSELGELEPVVNLEDALTLGELRHFLARIYDDVIIATNENEIDWRFPVVSLGGPIPNTLTRSLGEKGLLPVWFRGLPYLKSSERAIASSGGAEVFKSEFDEKLDLISDVGFIARVRLKKSNSQFLYVIAADYGIGNLGIVRHLTSTKELRQIHSLGQKPCFQAVIRTHMVDNNVVSTELVHYRSID